MLLCLFLLVLPAISAQASEEETREVTAQDLTLKIPKSWKQQQASNNLRLAQFAIEPVEGDEEPAELAIFPPFGGTVSENVKRWIDQFQSDDRHVTMTQGDATQGKYVLVDLTGTYNKPDGPPVMRKTKPVSDYRMVAVILTSSKGGNYFLKLTGPKKTVDAALDAFRKSFGADASKETKYDL
jgi:gluconolactonase